MPIFLVYHKIRDDAAQDAHAISPHLLQEHLQAIRASGVPFLEPREFQPAQNGVVITFDDGTPDHDTNVRPLLDKFGARAIFFVSTDQLDTAGHLTRAQVKALQREGHVIGSHSHVHKRLDLMSPEQVREQLATSAAVLADLLGAPPAHLAPPRGGYDATVRAVAAETGYTFCRTMRWGYNRPLDPLAIEIAPVTGAWGTWFLHEALRARNERLVKTLFFLKLGLRDSLGPLDYRKIRNTVAKLARG